MKQTDSTRRPHEATQTNPDLIARIEQVRAKLSKSEKRIVQFLLSDTHSFAHLNVKEVATATDVSEPTVVRFCRRVGCKGFKDLKMQIIQDLAYRQAAQENQATRARAGGESRPPRARLAATLPGELGKVPDAIHDAAVAALETVRTAIDMHAVESAARAIAQARRVVVYGIGGSSAFMATETHNRLFRLDINSVPHIDSYMQRMSAATLSDEDIAIFISSTGRPRTLLDSLELAKYYGAKCIGITPREGPIGREVDICIHLELTQGGVHPFHPNPMRYGQLYVIDCIAYAVALHLGPAAETSLKRTRASVASLHGIAPLQPIGD
jgi:RpiR family carbohydrate utilization transcriptional regulator